MTFILVVSCFSSLCGLNKSCFLSESCVSHLQCGNTLLQMIGELQMIRVNNMCEIIIVLSTYHIPLCYVFTYTSELKT